MFSCQLTLCACNIIKHILKTDLETLTLCITCPRPKAIEKDFLSLIFFFIGWVGKGLMCSKCTPIIQQDIDLKLISEL